MRRTAILGAILLAWTMPPATRADDAAVLPGESRTTATRLAEVRKKIDDKKYTEAITDLQTVLESAGNDLVPLTPQHSVQARRLCHRELAKLPPEVLREYRSRVEPQAKKWLDEAIPTRDVRLLHRIVDEAFCTRAGETAVDLLGDLAFERGRFDEALMWWRLLAPPLDLKKEERDVPALVYPDVQGDKAKLYAKQIVARFFAGDKEDAVRELTAFQKEYRKAEGTLAGRTGKYADLLQDILKQPPNLDKPWTTFGGDATRGLVLPAPPRWLERLSETVKDGPTWRFNLEARAPLADAPLAPLDKPLTKTEYARALAFHPLICGHYVIVSDAQFVTAIDWRTGKKTDWFDVTKDNKLAAPNLKLPAKADLRYTLTADDHCLYVRLGAQSVVLPEERETDKDAKIASFLACLSLDPDAKNRVRWVTRPLVLPGKPEWEQRGAIFEGAPVVANGSLYIAVTWFEVDRTVTAIQCYPAGTESLPQKRWQQTVCETHELKPKDQRTRHHLLTVAGPNVVYCSHSGAIVAVDAVTGKPAWAVRYPSRATTNADEPSLRELAPCAYAAGRLYVAPADYDHLLCLDPLTGEMLWDREGIAPTHLLGVGKGRLIFTTLAGLRAVNAADGSDTGGWFLPDAEGTTPPMGRGFLIGDVVVWPAVFKKDEPIPNEAVFLLRQEDGAPAEPISELKPEAVPAGNLVYSDGVLAVADSRTLSVYVPLTMQADEMPKDREPAAPAKGEREPPRKPTQPAASRAEEMQSWSLPWERTEEVRLAPGERFLALPGIDEGFLITAENGQVTFLPRDAARKRWMAMLPFRPTTAWIDGERVVLAGNKGLAALQFRDGEKLWIKQQRGCSGFQFADGHLFFHENEERLFAVDTATGETLWAKWALGARLHLRAPRGHFHPHLTLFATTLLVQPAPGRLWLLDPETGRILHEETNRFEPWPRAPVLLDKYTTAVVLDARTVALLDGSDGKMKWKHVSDDATTLSGEAPQLIADRENILLVTANNFSYTLERLDRTTGKPLWKKPPLLDGKTPPDAASWSLDKNAVYYAQDRVLTARSLVDGSILWRQALPDVSGDWRTRRFGDAVIAYPTDTGRRQLQFRWQMFSVQWELNHSRDIGVGRGLPVICCDAISGRQVQCLNLLAGPPRVRTRLGFLSRDAAPQVLIHPNDICFAIDAHLWRFTPNLSRDH